LAYLVIILGALLTGAALFRHVTQKQSSSFTQEEFSGYLNYRLKHGKSYTVAETEYRFGLYLQAVKRVAEKNAKNTWRSAVNKFSDLTIEEFKAKYLGFRPSSNEAKQYEWSLLNKEPSNDVDWRTTEGVVTGVKDQRSCGSCWAFSATGALEGASKLQAKVDGDYSEQQLVDCSTSYGNEGCDGGLMNQAFDYVIDNGITTEKAYPYKGVDQKCKSKVGDFKITSYDNVPPNSSPALANACDQQPVAVAIEADEIMEYESGIFADKSCGDALDHGVLLVGYTKDIWIVKNSWGTSWGEEGYIRFSRSAISDKQGGICGILSAASYPTV